MKLKNIKIAIIGLGYVGLPLAVEFGKKFKTLGFDINENRINELNKGIDTTLEVSNEYLTETLNFFAISFGVKSSAFPPINSFSFTIPLDIIFIFLASKTAIS